MQRKKELSWFDKIRLMIKSKDKLEEKNKELKKDVQELEDYILTTQKYPIRYVADRIQELDQHKVYYVEVEFDITAKTLDHLRETFLHASKNIPWTTPEIIFLNLELKTAKVVTNWTNPKILKNEKNGNYLIVGNDHGRTRTIECELIRRD